MDEVTKLKVELCDLYIEIVKEKNKLEIEVKKFKELEKALSTKLNILINLDKPRG